MNYVLTLQESFSGYLKQQTEHSMYEFQTLYTCFIHEGKHNGGDKLENIHMRKEATDCNTNNT